MKKYVLPLMLVLIVAFIAGCTPQAEITDSSLHPPEFNTYYAQLGWHKDSVLEDLGFTETELIETNTYTYATAKTVTFENLSFRVILRTGGSWNRFTGFSYMSFLEGDSKTQVSQILCLAQTLSKNFGAPTDGASAYPNHFAEMTAQELEAWLTDGKQESATDSWHLGQIKTQETVAYTAFLEGYHFASDTQTQIAQYPQLEVSLRVYKDGNGFVQVELCYMLDCFEP